MHQCFQLGIGFGGELIFVIETGQQGGDGFFSSNLIFDSPPQNGINLCLYHVVLFGNGIKTVFFQNGGNLFNLLYQFFY